MKLYILIFIFFYLFHISKANDKVYNVSDCINHKINHLSSSIIEITQDTSKKTTLNNECYINLIHEPFYFYQFITNAFDKKVITIESNKKYKIYWYGGTIYEPKRLSGWNTISCSSTTCQFITSKYGYFTPYGSSYISIINDENFITSILNNPMMKYRIIISKSYFDLKSFLMYGLSILLYSSAPIFAYNRVIHLSIGTIIGSLTFALLLIWLLISTLPTKRSTTIASSFGLLSILLKTCYHKITSFLANHVIFVLIYLLCGAIFGFSLSYKYRLNYDTQSLLIYFIRIICIWIIFYTSSHFYFAILTILCLFIAHFISFSNFFKNQQQLSSIDQLPEPELIYTPDHSRYLEKKKKQKCFLRIKKKKKNFII